MEVIKTVLLGSEGFLDAAAPGFDISPVGLLLWRDGFVCERGGVEGQFAAHLVSKDSFDGGIVSMVLLQSLLKL